MNAHPRRGVGTVGIWKGKRSEIIKKKRGISGNGGQCSHPN